MTLIVGMEEKAPGAYKQHLVQELTKRFDGAFKSLIFSEHPMDIDGEISGACSNRNYAARQGAMHLFLNEENENLLESTIVTVCDADTKFHSRYFECLTFQFFQEESRTRHAVCWQSPLFYNIALHNRWFFTRVIAILRSFFMIGFLIGKDINTMSVYSMSLKLLMESRFFHPGYQMDDILFTLSAMKATGKRIGVREINVPILSGPSSGVTFWKELEEWAKQATRWTIGAAEVFHYFVVKLFRCHYSIPGITYFYWFCYYYLFVLCTAGVIQMSDAIVMILQPSQPVWASQWSGSAWTLFKLAPLIYAYWIVFGTAFFMDAVIVNMFAPKEKVHWARNVLHFVSAQPVLWCYCMLEFLSIAKLAIQGKKVCVHKPSDKSALIQVMTEARDNRTMKSELLSRKSSQKEDDATNSSSKNKQAMMCSIANTETTAVDVVG